MTTNSKRGKKPYTKPEVKQIRLVAEEAILGGCKINQASGPSGNNCRQRGGCPTQGS
jgi:hypothetical protein